MIKNRKKITCIILSLVLIVTLIPEISFAVEGDENPSQTSGLITGFEPLETDSYYYEGDPAEEDITEKLPSSIKVYLNGSNSPTDLKVSWEALEDFDKTDFYFYSMKPVWDSNYILSSDVSPFLDVPWITVYKQEPDTENEPILDEEELDPIYVNEEELKKESGELMEEEPSSADPTPDGTDSNTEQQTEKDGNGNPDDDNISGLLRLFTEKSYADSSNTDRVYAYLTGTMGLNKAAACGVMTNINAESAMNPINLENKYNTLYGLTDTEYTKRVDAGKGAYKTRSGKSRNFKTDYCGYGLCQWTSLNRRKNLLSRAISQKTSVGNLNMQMGFLDTELRNSYSSVYRTLKSVPDNAQGAYIAAFVFCQSFEVPANTINTAASRARTCLSSGGYWKKYSGSSASTSSSSFLSICDYSYPQSLKTGKGMTCYGNVVSNYKLTNVSAVIRSSSGSTKYSASASPGAVTYSLKNLDSKMKFSNLPAGSYSYTVSAKDSTGKIVSNTHSFNVSSGGSVSTLRGFCCINNGVPATTPAPAVSKSDNSYINVSGAKYPSSIKKGRSFTLKGKIKSNYPLKKVKIRVYNSSGKVKLSATKKLSKSKSYNIKSLDRKIKFKKLSRGTYYYKLSAYNSKTSKILIYKKFTVK